MKKIRFKLLRRSVIVFACLTAVFASALISISFKRGYMAQHAHIFDALSACCKGVQSAHASYALKGADADAEKLSEIARQYDPGASVTQAEKAKSAVSYVKDGTLTAETDLMLGNTRYRISVSKSLSSIYSMRDMLTSIYRAAYLILIPLTAIIMYVSGVSISRPIEKLTETARAHTDGNRAKRTDIRTNDEIETLSNAFNRMADQVENEIRRREELIGDLTHEMKTPIQAIMGETDLMLLGRRNEDERYLSLETIHHQAQRLDRLSRRMMDWVCLSEESGAKMGACSVMRLFENIESLFALRRRIIIEETSAFILADSVLIETLLSNLVDNAINAEAKTIALSCARADGKICIHVSDDGCGMDEETLLHAAEPFYRADKARSRAHGGAGLGLSLAAKIARIHNTRLHFESEKGKGTRVTIAFEEALND